MIENTRVLILLTLLVISVTVLAIYHLDADTLSAYGSILAASGGFIAVIWFSASLWYQALQLKEQRIQFQKEFDKSHEEGRRNALLLARDILNNAEDRAIGMNPEISSISELFPLYMNFVEFKEIMESDDPTTVQHAVNSWMKKEGPAMAYMKGIKNAAQVYFTSIGETDIDYSHEPEKFVYIYGQLLWDLPYFDSLQGHASMLAEFMFQLEPGRKAVPLALFGAMAAHDLDNILKIESVRQDIKEHREKGYKIPKIAERL